jgi:hypothetical protein
MARSEISIDVPKTFAYRRLPVSHSKIAPILRSDRFALGAVASVGRGSGQRAVVVIGAARPGAPFHVTFACSLAAVLWAAFRLAPRAALTRERLAAVDALERLSGLHRDELVDDPHSPIPTLTLSMRVDVLPVRLSSPRRALSRTAEFRWPHIKAITTRYRN